MPIIEQKLRYEKICSIFLCYFKIRLPIPNFHQTHIQPEQIELDEINTIQEEQQLEENERNIEFNTNRKNATLRSEEKDL